MGNTMEVKLKEDKPVLEVTESLVEKFKEYISMADHSMSGLAKSLDAMRDACEMLLRQMDKDPQLQDVMTASDSEMFNSQQLARRLLEIIDASISDHKFVLMESISKLFSFVWSTGKSCIDHTENSPLIFQVDKYKSDRASVEDGVSFTDCRVRSLQREMKYLQNKCCEFEKEVSTLRTREVQYRKEIKILDDKNQAQEKRIEHLTKRNTIGRKEQNERFEVLNDDHENSFSSEAEDRDLNQIINNLKDEKISLQRELDKLEIDMKATKRNSEEQLKLKCEKIDNLEKEIEILKNESQSLSQSERDGEHLYADLEELRNEKDKKESKSKEVLSTFNECRVPEKTNKELQRVEYTYLTRSEDFDQNQIINDLKEENASLKQKLSSYENDAEADSESLSADQEESISEKDNIETKLKDEIKSLKQELVAVKSNKVLECLEYDYFSTTHYEILMKRDLYESITREMLSLNIDLKIPKWRPSRLISVPKDKVYIIPIFVYITGTVMNSIDRALKEMPVRANIAIVVFYDADRGYVRKEMESDELIKTEFKDLGGIFKFGIYSKRCLKEEKNDRNFSDFLKFLKGKCLDERFLSR